MTKSSADEQYMSLEKRVERLKNSVVRKRGPSGAKFEFAEFSPKQKTVICWWKSQRYRRCDGVIADGAVRSGKTVSMVMGFCLWAMSEFDGCSFAICGKTLGSLRRNVIEVAKQTLPALGFKISEKRSENLLIISGCGHRNSFYLFGGKDEGSQDLIQGMTLAGVYFDEVALMPESFVSQATARCSVPGSKWWFNCNPSGPYHWFKKGWIDSAAERNLLYLHFTMADNFSLTDDIRARYERMYSGVFYERYILGKWCMAEGLIYSMFDADVHCGELCRDWESSYLSCDYGTQNPFALGLIRRYSDGEKSYYLEKEFYHDGRKKGQLTDSQYADRVDRFAENTGADFIIVDPSAASFIAELRKRGWKVIKAKNDVMEGIRCVSKCISDGHLTVNPSCVNTLREFAAYVWDSSADSRGEDRPLKQNDHAMDMLRYAIYTDNSVTDRRRRYSGMGTRQAV